MGLLRRCADQLSWRPDGDVVVRFRILGDHFKVIPDATIASKRRRTRIFVEMDRSNKGLKRIGANLTIYRDFLEGPSVYPVSFPDGFTPVLLYIVPSDGRRRGIEEVCERVLAKKCSWRVRTVSEAPKWLAGELLDDRFVYLEPPPPPVKTPDPEVVSVVKSVLSWTGSLLGEIDRRGVLSAIRRDTPELLAQGKQVLTALENLGAPAGSAHV
jgi:hypothetical protein